MNLHKKQNLFYLLLSAVSIPVTFMLAQRLGLWSVALVYAIVDGLMVCYVIPDSLKYVNDRPIDFFQNILKLPNFKMGGTFVRNGD